MPESAFNNLRPNMDMELEEKKRKLIEFLLENNVLIGPDFLEKLDSMSDSSQIAVLVNGQIKASKLPRTMYAREGTVKIIFSYPGNPKKIMAQDFISHFNSRYALLKKILQQRLQLENITSIGKLKTKGEKETVSIIGMISSKEDTKNGMIISAEDPTGAVKVYFSKSKPTLISKANDLVLDEVIGISGSTGKNIIFANELYFPDIPITKEIKKSPAEEYAVFISDIHVGSKFFMEEEYMKFVNWLNGKAGSEKQKEMASKVNYVFITGDAIDGISITPGQKPFLNILTFREQYKKLAEYLKLIPEDIKIILCPGQHDIVPIAVPQIPLPKEYCKELFEIPNLILISNPAFINIAAREGFPGFDVLIYHGDSYNYYSDKVESIRVQKSNQIERAEEVMKFLLQKRHLAPTYDGNPHMPTETDYMVIDKIPDLFISGDAHKSAIFTYKGVITGVVSGCFQSQTPFQLKSGYIPDPGRVPILNLKTREIKILNFGGVK